MREREEGKREREPISDAAIMPTCLVIYVLWIACLSAKLVSGENKKSKRSSKSN